MLRITLVCSAGMSTSLLVTKMNAAAQKSGVDAKINAVAEVEMKDYWDSTDVLLLGPQVRFLLNKLKVEADRRHIPIEVINSIDYGTMNGEKVLSHALLMAKGR